RLPLSDCRRSRPLPGVRRGDPRPPGRVGPAPVTGAGARADLRSRVEPLPAPNLADDQILRIVAGLRPCRRGGLRLEAETLDTGAGGGRKTVVHNYGHGGCGVTIGFGCAEIAADLAQQALGQAPGVAGDSTARAQTGRPLPAIAVLGAGVIGLTTALELLRRGHP